jgi:hypothetical protein
MKHGRAVAALTVITAAAVITGCGPGAGPGSHDVSVLVTSDFGTHRIGRATEARVPGAETDLSLLERHFRVGTRYGGGFVESINGRSGRADRYDWFYYVNGVEAGGGAADTDVQADDEIWWDLHSWAATDSIPAVVGAYPEPFIHRENGRAGTTVLECGSGLQRACALIRDSLHSAGVRVAERSAGASAGSGSGSGSGSPSLTLLVDTWNQLKGQAAAGAIAGGPSSSGIYAQFAPAHGAARKPEPELELELDNPSGAVARRLEGSVGLIAANVDETTGQPVWFVTGTDATGVTAAAAAFSAQQLHGHFAVAVSGPRVIPLPVDPAT